MCVVFVIVVVKTAGGGLSVGGEGAEALSHKGNSSLHYFDSILEALSWGSWRTRP